jgi:hypothetical protein
LADGGVEGADAAAFFLGGLLVVGEVGDDFGDLEGDALDFAFSAGGGLAVEGLAEGGDAGGFEDGDDYLDGELEAGGEVEGVGVIEEVEAFDRRGGGGVDEFVGEEVRGGGIWCGCGGGEGEGLLGEVAGVEAGKAGWGLF